MVLRWSAALFLLLLPRSCPAAEVIGYLAEFSDTVESPRNTTLTQREKPRDLHVGDTVITRDSAERRAAARAFLADRQTIAIAGNSELVIGGMDAPDDLVSTSVELKSGRIRVYVSEGADCHIETPAAVVTCVHTDFVVAVDPRTLATDIVVMHGIVEVTGVGAAAGRSVRVLPYQMLHVAVGRPPGLPNAVGDAVRAQYTAGLEMIGHGTSERLQFGRELVDGTNVLVVDRPGRQRPEPWDPRPPQEAPGDTADPLFGVPGDLQVDY